MLPENRNSKKNLILQKNVCPKILKVNEIKDFETLAQKSFHISIKENDKELPYYDGYDVVYKDIILLIIPNKPQRYFAVTIKDLQLNYIIFIFRNSVLFIPF